ncbi:hypothetical protein PGT21_024019 [Puccinia graminis f. sp. tritici]|uniref:Uncharacterized protein n=1 Tax=Puccinia graminis f. sp. tritici TaxID=56615 RepID=A0A5B0MR42_PUCGR|nr:hypothetical protein PGT21_024019 [Puccinia graminis f. sp. tritici]KAA1078893.1 hypothetical protein PGTUg99_017229 [Puccinia graminis f. sp. tritici]
MAPKILSFIIIAASLNHQLANAMTRLLEPTSFVQHSVDTASPSLLDKLGTFTDFKHGNPFVGNPRFSGPAELPRNQHVAVLPHQMFREGSNLDVAATHQIEHIKNKNLKPLSIETEREYASLGKSYNALTDKERIALGKYMETEVITSSQADKIALERLNWFSRRSAGTIWWKAGLVGKADPRISDDIGLITIGDILRFGNEEQAMKLTNEDVEKMFRELKQVSLKNIHDVARVKPLNVKLLDQGRNIVPERPLLFEQRMTDLTNAASENVQQMSPEMKKDMFEALYLVSGYSPKQAQEFSKVALKNLDDKPDELGTLLKGPWKKTMQKLNLWKTPQKSVT